MRIVDLKADYIDRPLGLENPRPQLSWRLESEACNVRQRPCRIRVSSTERGARQGQADLWDSGEVNLRSSFGIAYRGRQLESRMRCWWCVQVWDESGNASAPSDPSWWEMGLLDRKDWSAGWLAAEDSVSQADSDAGLHWMWGTTPQGESSRKFRLRFHLPHRATSGELFAVAKDHWWSPITGIWFDGTPLVAAETGSVSGNPFALGSVPAGEHVIAVEIGSASFPILRTPELRAAAIFARLELQHGGSLRIGGSSDWKTSQTRDSDWYAPRYDDRSWEVAQPIRLEGCQPWPARPGVYLRREFSLQEVTTARLYVTALGAYEARLNGHRVGDARLTPEISQYAKRVLYRAYDVASLLLPGTNVLGLIIGDGWYASFDGRYAWGPPPRRAIAQLEVLHADGTRKVVTTGPGWRISASPIRASEIRIGEIYDARLEQPGWDAPGFDDSHWLPATAAPVPPCRLVAQASPPIRVTQTLRTHSVSRPRPDAYVFDFGQNFAGWCRLRASGPAGTRVELRFAELLGPSGEIDDSSSMSVLEHESRRDIYFLRGARAGELFEPHFNYRGFRYVQVSGLPSAATPQTLEGVVVHSDLGCSGRLRVEAPLIEHIWRNAVWTQRSNFVGIPTDCPSREQRGWMGDAGVFWDSAAFNMDVAAFTSRQMDNVLDDQAEDGPFPMVAPEPIGHPLFPRDGTPPAWGEGGIVLPWTAWRRYGDLSIVERSWDAMLRHMQFILDNNPRYVWQNKRGYDFGDWCALGENNSFEPGAAPTTPGDLIGTAYWAHSADLLAQMADATGRTAETERFRALFRRIRNAFNEAFVSPDGTVGNDSQTSYILALKFGLLPEQSRKGASERLVADIRARGVALTTGIIGTQFSLDVLADAGFSTLVYDLLLRTDYPSWGYMIRNGATTVWENWSGDRQYKGNTLRSSQNHFALGSVCGFLFRRIAGIDAATPGFETVVIRPLFDARVTRGGGDYDSIIGRISTDWTHDANGGCTLKVTIPPNATAHVHLPARKSSRIFESDCEVSDQMGMHMRHRSETEVVVEVGSGSYRFAVVS